MRKCYYTYENAGEKIIIPQCWNVVISGNIGDCTCRSSNELTETFPQFERKEYNKKLKEQRESIKALEQEVVRLNRILKRVNGFR